MRIIDWAVSIKPDLVSLQRSAGIPALFAAGQFCHESAARDGGLTELARVCHNYAGIKWVGDWQLAFGARPVTYGTWEHIGGQDERLDAAFAAFPDWLTWLRAYTYLLSVPRYRSAMTYAGDPFLYGYYVWRSGWATDPAYLYGIAKWIAQLWPHYSDTLPPRPEEYPPVAITVNGQAIDCRARLQDGTTWIEARRFARQIGGDGTWQGEPSLAFHMTLPLAAAEPAPAPRASQTTNQRGRLV